MHSEMQCRKISTDPKLFLLRQLITATLCIEFLWSIDGLP
jgi:hypothetical protein